MKQLHERSSRFLWKRVEQKFYRPLDSIIPKNDKVCVFSAKPGRYADNARALFRYMAGIDSIDVYWLAHSEQDFERVGKDVGYSHVVRLYSKRGLWISLRAQFVFFAWGLGDHGPYRNFSSRTTAVLMWHAITVKKLGVQIKNPTRRHQRQWKPFTRMSLLTASSEIDGDTLSKSFMVDRGKVKVTGLPRNDELIRNRNTHKKDLKLENEITWGFLRRGATILYAPTWRDDRNTKLFPFDDFDGRMLDTLLSRRMANLLIRMHRNEVVDQFPLLSRWLVSSDRVYFAPDTNEGFPDVVDLLPFVDLLITDYSSIYLDFLLLDRPVIFVPYDIEDYQRKRGLAYNYNEITPGPHVFSMKEFLSAVENGLSGDDGFRDDRLKVKRLFHKYEDGRSSERIYRNLVRPETVADHVSTGRLE